MHADLARQTLTTDVYGPPELTPYPTEIDGPYVARNGEFIRTSEAGWVWWASRTVVWQRTRVDDRGWDRAFWSYYLDGPSF